LSALLAKREVSSVELAELYLSRIDRCNADLNALITVDTEGALAAAKNADDRLQSGAAGALTGIPIVHKDIFCTQGVKTSCGSRMLDNFVAPYDATVVTKLKEAGTVTLGKANMDEFAMGSSNENSFYGSVANPWNASRVPGGSSGGSAAVVSARLAPAATGTDTGGSIRQPAAFCGITGIKPTYGRVSRYGMIAFASSLDQGGPLAATAEDCALLLEAMAGHDPRDSTSIDHPTEPYSSLLDKPLNGLRIGKPKEYFSEGLDPAIGDAVSAAIDELERLGASIHDISLPNQHLCVPAYYVVAPAECSSNLSRFDGVRFGYRCDSPIDLEDLYIRSRGEGFGREVKRRILIGTYALSAGYYDAYYRKAQQIRQLISDDFNQAFQQVDLIVGPATPTVAFEKGSKTDDPVAMYLNDLYTISANLAGIPAISLPCGSHAGLPIGQLSTDSKIFSGAATAFGAEPNTQACAVDLGLPGVLPVVNREAVRKAVRFALSTGAEIGKKSVFARKNYFYPDLPKGYQISQMALPIVGTGSVDIALENGDSKTIRITRAHLEEDAGKSLHEEFAEQTGIDLNRAGTPLLEIVSEPDMRSAKEAVAYARLIHSLVRFIDICDGNMQEGSFRCDANVSVRLHGDEKLGTRAEIKNLNSFRFLEKAIDFEVERQIDLLETGVEVVQETRLYDADLDETRSMRSTAC